MVCSSYSRCHPDSAVAAACRRATGARSSATTHASGAAVCALPSTLRRPAGPPAAGVRWSESVTAPCLHRRATGCSPPRPEPARMPGGLAAGAPAAGRGCSTRTVRCSTSGGMVCRRWKHSRSLWIRRGSPSRWCNATALLLLLRSVHSLPCPIPGYNSDCPSSSVPGSAGPTTTRRTWTRWKEWAGCAEEDFEMVRGREEFDERSSLHSLHRPHLHSKLRRRRRARRTCW